MCPTLHARVSGPTYMQIANSMLEWLFYKHSIVLRDADSIDKKGKKKLGEKSNAFGAGSLTGMANGKLSLSESLNDYQLKTRPYIKILFQMKVHTPEISWHGRDPVYSCDVQPHQGGKSPLRIATCGTDSNIRVSFWHLKWDVLLAVYIRKRMQ